MATDAAMNPVPDHELQAAIRRDKGGPTAQMLTRLAAERDSMMADLAKSNELAEMAVARLGTVAERYQQCVEQRVDEMKLTSALDGDRHDLAMIVRRMLRHLDRTEDQGARDVAADARDFLTRKGLNGSPMRSDT